MNTIYQLARRCSRALPKFPWLESGVRGVAEPLLHRLYGKRGLEWSLNGVPCRVDPRYRGLMHPQYDAQVAEYVQARLKPGHVCLDVGANIGAWALQFAAGCRPHGKVYAFEPNPGAREVLQKHISMNDFDSIVEVVPMAVGSASGTVELAAHAADGMSRVGAVNPLLADVAVSIQVPMTTLDDWNASKQCDPDWLFLDIEGFEEHALAGARRMIREAGPKLHIILEMHPTLWASCRTDRTTLEAEVRGLERRVVPLSGQRDPFVDYGHVLLEPLDRPA